MVLSKISDIVNYKETSHFDKKDVGHEASLYIVPLLNSEYVVALGKQRMDFIEKGIVYYPIYLITPKEKIKAKIGIFEIDTRNVLNLLDDDGDIDLNKFSLPLLFSFVNESYLEKYGNHGENMSLETMPENNDKEDKKEDEDEDEDEDGEFFIEKQQDVSKKDTAKDISIQEDKITLETLFDKKSVDKVNTWDAETATDAKKFREEYKLNKNSSDNWVSQFMKNKEYKIHLNEGSVDSLFLVIRDAFGSKGKHASVEKIRKFLSQEVNEDLFKEYKNLYDGIMSEKEFSNNELSKLEKINNKLKKESDLTKSLNKQKEIINEAVLVKQNYNDVKIQKEGSESLLTDFGFMKHIQNVEDLKSYVQSSDFLADSWALSTLELILSLKFIILEKTDDFDSVILCTQANEYSELYDKFNPENYIMMLLSNNNNYELISYRDKKIFSFSEVPYDMKKKIIQKCVQNNDQSYYAKIPDIQEFRKNLGVGERSSDEIEKEESYKGALFDPNIILYFHAKSDIKKKAGKLDSDSVPYGKLYEFSKLNSFEQWRRKLDDDWAENPFITSDGKRWNSITHYLLALSFKESFPAIFEDFSDDSKSEISQDVVKAKESLEKKKGKVGKYFETFKKTTALDKSLLEAYRKDALKEKFDSQSELGRMLKATNLAKLMRYRKGREPLVDISLMEVRNEMNNI